VQIVAVAVHVNVHVDVHERIRIMNFL